jgi:hypothetical protein
MRAGCGVDVFGVAADRFRVILDGLGVLLLFLVNDTSVSVDDGAGPTAENEQYRICRVIEIRRTALLSLRTTAGQRAAYQYATARRNGEGLAPTSMRFGSWQGEN